MMCPPARAADAAAQCAPLPPRAAFHTVFAFFPVRFSQTVVRALHAASTVSLLRREQSSGFGQRHGEKTGRAGGLHEATCFVRRRGGQQLGGGQQAAHFGIIRRKSSRRRPPNDPRLCDAVIAHSTTRQMRGILACFFFYF